MLLAMMGRVYTRNHRDVGMISKIRLAALLRARFRSMKKLAVRRKTRRSSAKTLSSSSFPHIVDDEEDRVHKESSGHQNGFEVLSCRTSSGNIQKHEKVTLEIVKNSQACMSRGSTLRQTSSRTRKPMCLLDPSTILSLTRLTALLPCGLRKVAVARTLSMTSSGSEAYLHRVSVFTMKTRGWKDWRQTRNDVFG